LHSGRAWSLLYNANKFGGIQYSHGAGESKMWDPNFVIRPIIAAYNDIVNVTQLLTIAAVARMAVVTLGAKQAATYGKYTTTSNVLQRPRYGYHFVATGTQLLTNRSFTSYE